MTRRRVAILGGGMAGMAAAWRLSEPGWRDRFSSIVVYQRGWRLGGKGASSRGAHGRIEEHGLHVWLGYYENAFALLREIYDELDRASADPTVPIRTWLDAMIPASTVGLMDDRSGAWEAWVSTISGNEMVPGESGGDGVELTPAEFVRRALVMLRDFAASLPGSGAAGTVTLSGSPVPPTGGTISAVVGAAVIAAITEASSRALRLLDAGAADELEKPLRQLMVSLRRAAAADADVRRWWHLLTMIMAMARGVVAEGLLSDPVGIRRLNDRELLEWVAEHGADPDAFDSPVTRGLYSLVFGFHGGDVDRPAFPAGLAVLLTTRVFLDFKGSIFWKMTAGMGDVVFAPMFEVLRQRGVSFEFFHRVDRLRLSSDGLVVDAIEMGRQVRLAAGVEQYDPLIRVKGLPCFADAPDVGQLDDLSVSGHDLESHWCEWPDAERLVLKRKRDFDDVVCAMSLGMVELTCGDLIDTTTAWREMVTHVKTVGTQALQLWLREDEPSLGWPHPGATVSAFKANFDTWASMPQIIDAENWPDDDAPRSIAYFCSALPDEAGPTEADARIVVRDNVREFLARDIVHLLPRSVASGCFRWELLCGSNGEHDEPLESQFYVANVDPSDRYVLSLPGSDKYRLRPDESGYDNLVLAGDWTDNGINAGCIEAAVISGLQAANALGGRHRWHRISGLHLR